MQRQRALIDGFIAAHRHRALRAVVLHADGARASRATSRRAAIVYDCMDELAGVRGRAARAARRGARAARARRRRVHRRPDPLRSQAAPPSATSTRSRAASTSRTSRSARQHRPDPAGSGGHPAPAPRLLRRASTSGWTSSCSAGVAAARPGLASRAGRPGRQDRSGHRCRGARTSTTSGRSRTTICPTTSPAGTSPCCRLRATRRRGSSARRRRPSIWRPASRWSRRRSATSSGPTASRGWRASPTRPTTFVAAVEAALARGRRARGRAAPTRSCARRRGTGRGRGCVTWSTASIARDAAPTRLAHGGAPDAAAQFAIAITEEADHVRLSRRRRRLRRRRARGAARRRRRQEGPDLSTSARTSAATPTTTTTRPAFWSTSTDRTSSTPTRATSSTTCRGSPTGGRTSIACGRGSTASCVPIPINLDTINPLYGTELHVVPAGGVLRVGRRAARRRSAPPRT